MAYYINQKEVIQKMKIFIAILAFVLISGVCYAADQQHTPKATEPIGAVVETMGVFVGKMVAAGEEACTGKKEVTVDPATGDTKVFPFGYTVELIDKGFHLVTLNGMKPGEDATVQIKKALSK